MKRTAALAMLFLIFACVAVAQDDLLPWPERHYPEPTAIADQPEPECDHLTDSAERFEQMRILPPAKIKSFDPRTIDTFTKTRRGFTSDG